MQSRVSCFEILLRQTITASEATGMALRMKLPANGRNANEAQKMRAVRSEIANTARSALPSHLNGFSDDTGCPAF